MKQFVRFCIAEIRGEGLASLFEGMEGKHDIELSIQVHITRLAHGNPFTCNVFVDTIFLAKCLVQGYQVA